MIVTTSACRPGQRSDEHRQARERGGTGCPTRCSIDCRVGLDHAQPDRASPPRRASHSDVARDGLGGPCGPGGGLVVAAHGRRLAADHHRDVVPAPDTVVERAPQSCGCGIVDGSGDERIEIDDPAFVGGRRTVVDDQIADTQRRRPVDRADRIAVTPRANTVDVAAVVAAFRRDQTLVSCSRADDVEEAVQAHGSDVHLPDGDLPPMPPPDETERSGDLDRRVQHRHDAGFAEHGVHHDLAAASARRQHPGGDVRIGVTRRGESEPAAAPDVGTRRRSPGAPPANRPWSRWAPRPRRCWCVEQSTIRPVPRRRRPRAVPPSRQ